MNSQTGPTISPHLDKSTYPQRSDNHGSSTSQPVQSDRQRTESGQKHIALFIPNLDGGGAERAMIHLAEGFARQGWQADLVVAMSTGAYVQQLPETINLVNLQARSPQVLTKTISLARYLRAKKPDVLLTTLDIVNAAGIARWLSGSKTKVIMVVQTHLSQQFQDRHSIGVQYLRSQIVKLLYPLADEIVSVSYGVAKNVAKIMARSPETIRVIYNPVVPEDLSQKVTEPVNHPWFDEDVPIILGAGRIVKQKDFLH